jgi:hypothetical protein
LREHDWGVSLGPFGKARRTAATTSRAAAGASVKKLPAGVRETTDFPYPGADRVRFYFLTFDGVRVIYSDLASITNGTNKYAELFRLGQAVLTEL